MTEEPSVQAGPARPSLWFRSITFSDGTNLKLEKDDIVVFVGPNNAGKSASLRELEHYVARPTDGLVIKSVEMGRTGTSVDLKTYLEANAQKSGDFSNVSYGGIGYRIHHSHVNFFDQPHDRHPVAPFFAKRMPTESRIQDSNAAPALAIFQDPPTHPIHLLLMDDVLAAHISAMFKQAFGKDLTVFRAGGSQFPLFVGEKPQIPLGKDELSREFINDLLRTNVRLDEQGDGMRSFAAVILHVLASTTHSIQFLDEPEAFLHPPQARLLGRFLASNRPSDTQIFIATHSTDVLDGLIESGSEKVRIVRLRREEGINRAKELGKSETSAIISDTLTRFSGVFEGIFFEHVVICESDADCLFYQSLLHLPAISGTRRPDVLFIHAAGKHRMCQLARTLRSLDVPVSVVADIDVISEEKTMSDLLLALGCDWSEVKGHWKSVVDAILQAKAQVKAHAIGDLIKAALEHLDPTAEFPKEARKKIETAMAMASPWAELKRNGISAIPSGVPTQQFGHLREKCANVGLWIVEVGEMEGFCKSEGGHGPNFVSKVLENHDLATDPQLAQARTFVKEIWDHALSQKSSNKSPVDGIIGDATAQPNSTLINTK